VLSLQTQNVGAAARLDGHDASEDVEVTCVRFDNDGLKLAAGTSEGHTLTYDMRSSRPISVKDHRNGGLMLNEMFEPKNVHALMATLCVSARR